MTYGLHVSGPSVASAHAGSSPRSNARSVRGVRSRTAVPSATSNSIVHLRQGSAAMRTRRLRLHIASAVVVRLFTTQARSENVPLDDGANVGSSTDAGPMPGTNV